MGFDHSFNVMTWESGKCFQDLMSFAAEGSAMMRKFPPAFGSFVRVLLWQWSDFDWDMIMRFGSGISVREEIQGASFIFELEKKGWKMFEAPDSQGSMTIVNVVDWPGVGGNGRIGWNVRRKEASAFRCLTVKDMLGSLLLRMCRIWYCNSCI